MSDSNFFTCSDMFDYVYKTIGTNESDLPRVSWYRGRILGKELTAGFFNLNGSVVVVGEINNRNFGIAFIDNVWMFYSSDQHRNTLSVKGFLRLIADKETTKYVCNKDDLRLFKRYANQLVHGMTT